jgi:hypothetical protein
VRAVVTDIQQFNPSVPLTIQYRVGEIHCQRDTRPEDGALEKNGRPMIDWWKVRLIQHRNSVSVRERVGCPFLSFES